MGVLPFREVVMGNSALALAYHKHIIEFSPAKWYIPMII